MFKIKNEVKYKNKKTGRKFNWKFEAESDSMSIIGSIISFIFEIFPIFYELITTIIQLITNGPFYYLYNRFFYKEFKWKKMLMLMTE